MKSLIFILVVSVLSANFWSCTSIRTFRSGTTGSNKSYTAIPEYYGEKAVKTYASASYSTGKAEQSGFATDDKYIISLNAHRAHADKFYAFYYGAGASYGQYTFNSGLPTVIETGEKRSFFSIDSKVGGLLQKAWNSIDWRILYAELTYSYEFGEYQDKLDELEGQFNTIKIYNNPSNLAYNFNTELVYKVNRDNAFGLGFFYGEVLDSNEAFKEKADFGGITMHYRYSEYTFSLVGNSTADNDVSSWKFGLTYNFL